VVVKIDIEQISKTGGSGFVVDLVGAPPLQCAEIVRRIPARRIVCRGMWDTRMVYAKIFLGPGAQRYARRDQRGMQVLAAKGILAPRLLHSDFDETGTAQVLVYQAIENSVGAEAVWTDLPPHSAKRLGLAKKLVSTVAHHHTAGLMQTDLYLKNFLLQGERVYTLDGDAIRPLPRFFSRRAALSNLALLLSKFDIVDEVEWLPELLAIYASERDWSETPDIDSMRKRIAAIRREVAEKYAGRKVFRECTEVKVSRKFDRYEAVARSLANPAMMRALEAPDRLLGEAQLQRLKSGNTCTVSLTEIDGRKLVVKRYNIKSLGHAFSRALRQSRAAVSWSNAYRLKMHDIATAAPAALVEKRLGFIRRQAYFLAEYVEAPDISKFFAAPNVAPEAKAMAAREVARLFWKLSLLGISHGDFKATNVKIVEGRPLLIDLDSMRQHRCRWIFGRRHRRDLRRFWLNWQQDLQTKALLANAFKEFYKDPRPLQQAGWL
jgi:tRNA A-37 threonylcarbamoyl transferase component Bud32